MENKKVAMVLGQPRKRSNRYHPLDMRHTDYCACLVDNSATVYGLGHYVLHTCSLCVIKVYARIRLK